MDGKGHLLGYGQLFLAFVADLVWYVFVKSLLADERGSCWIRETMIASGLLNLCHCCALRLDGQSRVGNYSYLCLLGRAYNTLLYHCCTTPLICLCELVCKRHKVYNLVAETGQTSWPTLA
jgi:hypothetical protein